MGDNEKLDDSIYRIADMLDYRIFHEVLPNGEPGDRCVIVRGNRVLGGPDGRQDMRRRLVRMANEKIAKERVRVEGADPG